MSTTPTTTYQTNTGFSPDIQRYADSLLGKAGTLTGTDPTGAQTIAPYQTYSQWAQQQGLSGDMNAQFTGLQNTAFQQGQGLSQNPYSQNAAIGTENTLGNSWANPGTAQQFMSPYEQNVINLQQQDAARQAGIQTTQNDAQATGAGAFGGSRQAVMDAENQRNLGIQQANIEASGMQNAYTQGENQFNTQQQTGLAGLSNLGSMGQNLYGQTTGNINLQDQLGTQQQQQAQNTINNNISNYQNAQNYPYMQLGFESDILHGAPTTGLGGATYQAPSGATVPGLISAGAGLLGAGTSSTGTTAKNGGIMQSRYKGGGLATLLAHSVG